MGGTQETVTISEAGQEYLKERRINRQIPLTGEDYKSLKTWPSQKAYMFGLCFFEDGFYFERRSAADPTDLAFNGVLRAKAIKANPEYDHPSKPTKYVGFTEGEISF